MSELPKQAPEVRPTPPSSGEMLRTMCTTDVDQLRVEKNGSKPDRESAEYKAFSDEQLSGIDFENRQDWQKNAEKEKALSEASRRRLESLTPPKSKEIIPSPIEDALNMHRQYVDGGKTNRVLLAQAISALIGYIPSGKAMTPINRVSSAHKRQLLLGVEKDGGGDWTQTTLGVFALELEADRYPSVSQQIKDLVSDAVDVAGKPWQNR